MSADPYGKDTIPARTRGGRGLNVQFRMLPQPRRIAFSAWTGWEASDPAVSVPRGYAVVNADLRGAGTFRCGEGGIGKVQCVGEDPPHRLGNP